MQRPNLQDRSSDAHAARRRITLGLTIVFLALNLAVLGLVLPAFMGRLGETLDLVTVPISLPDRR